MADKPIASLEEEEAKKEKAPSKLSGEERIKVLDEWFLQGAEVEHDFLKQAFEDEQFYKGKQWDANDLEKLREDGRPALTYNHIFPVVNLVNGYHRQNRQDMKVYNVQGGTRNVAEILTSLLKHIKQTKNGDWEIAHAHLMGLITGKSYVSINVDYDHDILRGDLFYEFNSCFDILLDPYGERYDLSDRDFMVKSAWLPKQKIERTFPGKIDSAFEVMVTDRMSFNSDVETFTYQEAAEYHEQEKEDIRKYRYRVKEFWWKEYERKKFLVNMQTGKVFNVSPMSKKAIKRIQTVKPELQMIERTRPILHMSQYVGKTELFYRKNPMGGMKNFPIAPFFPYFVRNSHQGIITQLKDPQREHNKRMSQALHHLNTSANSGYTADADAVDDWNELETNLSKPGYIKKIKPGKRFDKDQPSQLSQGHVELAMHGANSIKHISNVNADMLGEKTGETQSGVAIARRQAQGMIGTEIIHDNLRLTMKILGDRTIESIQKSGAYSQQEVLRLVVDGDEKEYEINQKMEGINKVF